MFVCVHLYTISLNLDVLAFFLLLYVTKTNMGMKGFVTVHDEGKSEQELKART